MNYNATTKTLTASGVTVIPDNSVSPVKLRANSENRNLWSWIAPPPKTYIYHRNELCFDERPRILYTINILQNYRYLWWSNPSSFRVIHVFLDTDDFLNLYFNQFKTDNALRTNYPLSILQDCQLKKLYIGTKGNSKSKHVVNEDNLHSILHNLSHIEGMNIRFPWKLRQKNFNVDRHELCSSRRCHAIK